MRTSVSVLIVLFSVLVFSSFCLADEIFDETRAKAVKGDANAQNKLGVMTENSECVPQDYAEAAKWYRKAADQGAQFLVVISTAPSSITLHIS